MDLEEAKRELEEVNNKLTLLMKKKNALKEFIENECNRAKKISSPPIRAYLLKNDPEFIKEHNGRKRTDKEIGNIMGYDERSIQRFFQKLKKMEEDTR
jgi:hypothetical protein